ncbi:RYamide receptor-like [Dreissena polymorpha]|uniref:RYamide receptor-like n=1 Tax=Dreissena polymorpha TaxID=45954 RepID=UPI002264E77D|nr:RYamide receptor-like [Dreissena polymorpha]
MRLGSGNHRNYSAYLRPSVFQEAEIELTLLDRRPYSPHLLDNTHEIASKMPDLFADNASLDYVMARNSSVADFNRTWNISENSTIEPYVQQPLTAQHYVFVLMYTVTTLLAIFGNSMAMVIFCKGKRSKTELRPFLINLALADLIMAVFCIPFTFTYHLLDSNWVFSEPMCPIVMFLQVVSVTVSVSTNMAIGIDRFCAIVFPLNASRNNPRRYRIIIVLLWLISLAFGSVQLIVGRTEYSNYEKHLKCGEHWSDDSLSRFYTILVLFLTYIVPVVILTVTYSIVGYILWKRNLPGNADAQRDRSQLKAKVKVG